MTEELEVIKWACEHGLEEGFRIGCVVKHGDCVVCPDNGAVTYKMLAESKVYWPLFLQRTIEGINRNAKWYISQDPCGLVVSLISSWTTPRPRENFFKYVDFDTIDQAKFAAIKYVKEHVG